jgi:curved DNA-binding protein CbpA
MTAPLDPYKTLQVDSEAEEEVIAAAYRRLARKYHPDVSPGPEAAARMTAINAAWALIGDPARRAAYDRERAVREAMTRSATDAVAHDPRGAATSGTAPSSPGGTPVGAAPPPRPAETVSRDWTSGRSSYGGGYDPSMRTADHDGAAGPPPGNPSGSVLTFGRYAGWSIGEIGRSDLGYLEWLDRMPIGRPYREEIDAILRRTGRRRAAEVEATERRGLFRRR